MRRHVLLIALPACTAVLGLAPVAARADVVPAPPGHASGVAAQVGSLLDISKTGATADSGAPSAEASVLRLGGQPLLNLGGTQHGDGATGGALLDTGNSLPPPPQGAPRHAPAHGTHRPPRPARGAAAPAPAGGQYLLHGGGLAA